jgi:Uma2 family endonuclease
MLSKETVFPARSSTASKMSFEEFLQWVDEDTHTEWVNGEVITFMPAKRFHQDTLDFLRGLLAMFAGFFHLGRVMTAPYGMKLKRAYREPDIFWVASENLKQRTVSFFDGPADLAIEIISDDSVQRDRREKLKEYREAGVKEYWIIDPRPGKQRADFYRLDETGDYDLFATEDDERVESAVLPGFWLRPAWLWQIDEITPLEAFYEIRGLSAEQIEQIQQLLRGGETP